MKQIIEWCNINQGFVSVILSFTTILISVLTLRLTYKIGKMPFRKEISITPHIYKEGKDWMLDVLIVNSGLVTVMIDSVIATNKDGLVIGVGEAKTEPEILLANSYIRKKIRIFDDKENIEKNVNDLNDYLRVKVYEYNGMKHEKCKGFPVG